MKLKKATGLLAALMLSAAGLHAQVKRTTHSTINLSASIANGKKVYTEHCLTCHQADGLGIPNMNPPLFKTTYVLGNKTRLIQIVLNGFTGDIPINDQYYSNTMPPHDFLSDQEIADVLTYVRNNFGNKSTRISAWLVKTVRAANKKQ